MRSLELKERKRKKVKQERLGEPFVRQIHVIQNRIYDLTEEIQKLYAWASLEEKR